MVISGKILKKFLPLKKETKGLHTKIVNLTDYKVYAFKIRIVSNQ